MFMSDKVVCPLCNRVNKLIIYKSIAFSNCFHSYNSRLECINAEVPIYTCQISSDYDTFEGLILDKKFQIRNVVKSKNLTASIGKCESEILTYKDNEYKLNVKIKEYIDLKDYKSILTLY